MATGAPAALESFERERRSFLDAVAAAGTERLTARPADDAWSLLDVVEHLVVAEQEVLQGLPPPADLVARRRGLRDRLRHRIVLLVLRRGFTVPVPSPTMRPGGELGLAELTAMWDENQAWLRGFLETVAREGDRGAVFSHPVSGPIGVTDTVHLMRTHLRSHARDVRKLGVDVGRG
jgi:hypothetical protein